MIVAAMKSDITCLSLFLIDSHLSDFVSGHGGHCKLLSTHMRTFVSIPLKAELAADIFVLLILHGSFMHSPRSYDSSDLSLDAVLSVLNKLGRVTPGESSENSYTLIIFSRCYL